MSTLKRNTDLESPERKTVGFVFIYASSMNPVRSILEYLRNRGIHSNKSIITMQQGTMPEIPNKTN